jgi:transcriptional regulator with GAF, ATPase, and Fis domain
MARLVELARQIARADLAVIVRGETGTGKEHVARALHQFSPRSARPFVTVNCAAVQDTLVESELFGHEKGAFTGATSAKPGLLEICDGGTVFLDEVGELSAAMQAKLLRALDAKRITRVGSVVERAIDIRVVAATHRDLDRDVAAGRFRSDLLFRLAGATIVIPPLRERPLDIALLARTFADEACARAQHPPMPISCSAMRALTTHAWPGNVRELRNAIDYVAAMATATTTAIDVAQLPAAISGGPAEPPPEHAAPSQRFRPIADELAELERKRMREAIAAAGGVVKAAASLIRMPLRTFHLKAKQYGLKA